MNKYLEGLEPVRVIGWITTAIVFAAAVIKQIVDSYDEGTGWMGLALAAVLAISTELQRARVTSMKGLTVAAESIGGGSGPTDGH